MPTLDDLAVAARTFVAALDQDNADPESVENADAATRARLDLFMWFVQRGWRPPEAEAMNMLADFDLIQQAYGSIEDLPARQQLIRLTRGDSRG